MLLGIPSLSGVKLIIIACLLPGFPGETIPCTNTCPCINEMHRESIIYGQCLNCQAGLCLTAGCLCKSKQPDRQSRLLLQQAATYPWQEGTQQGVSSTADTRPGYKWDQFLTIPDATHKPRSLMHTLLTKFLPSWVMQSHQTSQDKLAQPFGNDDTQPVELNNATWVPILPAPIAWMMHSAEDRIEKAGINLPKAQLLAKLTSVSYCQRNNIQAWNCSR